MKTSWSGESYPLYSYSFIPFPVCSMELSTYCCPHYFLALNRDGIEQQMCNTFFRYIFLKIGYTKSSKCK